MTVSRRADRDGPRDRTDRAPPSRPQRSPASHPHRDRHPSSRPMRSDPTTRIRATGTVPRFRALAGGRTCWPWQGAPPGWGCRGSFPAGGRCGRSCGCGKAGGPGNPGARDRCRCRYRLIACYCKREPGSPDGPGPRRGPRWVMPLLPRSMASSGRQGHLPADAGVAGNGPAPGFSRAAHPGTHFRTTLLACAVAVEGSSSGISVRRRRRPYDRLGRSRRLAIGR